MAKLRNKQPKAPPFYVNANRPKLPGRPKGGAQGYDWGSMIPVILERIAGGEALKRIISETGMPSMPEMLKHMHSDKWVKQYRAAQSMRAASYGFKMEEVIESVEDGSLSPHQGRVMGDMIKIRMGQLAPREYNDRVIQHTIDHKIEVSVRDRLQRADQRSLQAPVIEDVDYDIIES